MAPDLSTAGHPLRPLDLERLISALPEAEEVAPGVVVTLERFDRLIDSSSMTPQDWVGIARRIADNYDTHDGFIIVQGTDTLAFTASALSFMLENLGKPVALTGSQLPLLNARTDARQNYAHALQVAGHRASGLPLIPEVVVVFGDSVLRGCRARKMSTGAFSGFKSPNCPPLGVIGETVRIFENRIRPAPPPGAALQIHATPNQNVLDIPLFPGLQARFLRQIFSHDEVRGIVLRTFGSGNAPENAEFVEALRGGCRKDRKVTVNITQCTQGTVIMGHYAASLALIDLGVISGFDMTPEAALAKLMVTLGRCASEQVVPEMLINQRGEQSQSQYDLTFVGPMGTEASSWSGRVVQDHRFVASALSGAVLHIKSLDVTLSAGAENPCVDLYVNFPSAGTAEVLKPAHPRRLHRLRIENSGQVRIVEKLPKDKLKRTIGEGAVTLTLVASPGVTFKFDSLVLSMFTRA